MNVVTFVLMSGLVLAQFWLYRRHERKHPPPPRAPYPVSRLTRWFGVARLPLYAAGFIHLGVYRLLLRPDGPDLVAFAAGFGLALAGVALIGWALHALGDNFSACNRGAMPAKRVVSGPYRVLRHPIYVGNLMLVGGVVIVAPGAPIYAVLALLAVFYVAAARDENRALERL
jgi:protein-S-isoprenylcysteine O-methyltransferase Ste14